MDAPRRRAAPHSGSVDPARALRAARAATREWRVHCPPPPCGRGGRAPLSWAGACAGARAAGGGACTRSTRRRAAAARTLRGRTAYVHTLALHPAKSVTLKTNDLRSPTVFNAGIACGSPGLDPRCGQFGK